jgi:hypothetical protein
MQDMELRNAKFEAHLNSRYALLSTSRTTELTRMCLELSNVFVSCLVRSDHWSSRREVSGSTTLQSVQ